VVGIRHPDADTARLGQPNHLVSSGSIRRSIISQTHKLSHRKGTGVLRGHDKMSPAFSGAPAPAVIGMASRATPSNAEITFLFAFTTVTS
jgi:hypothetical protein